MNSDGGIKRLKVGEKAPDGHIMLTPAEYQKLAVIPEQNRPEELAVMRFTAERRLLGAPNNIHIQNAFRIGFRTSIAMLTQGRPLTAEEAKVPSGIECPLSDTVN